MLAEQIEQYLTSLVTLRSPQTISWYRKRLAPLRSLPQNMCSITLLDLQAVYAGLAQRQTQYLNHPSGRAPLDKPLAPATLRGYVRAWRAFFNWAVDGGVIGVSPARKLKLPPIAKQPPKAISCADKDRLLAAARLTSSRDYAIVCILADSACRAGGLCHITLDNLDLDRQQAIVIEKGQTRFLLFTDHTVAALRDYLRDRPETPYREVFIGHKGLPLQPGGIHALLDRLADGAGVQGRHNPHAFRHGWARAALAGGADLSDVAHVLGHAQIQTTFEFYGRWDATELHDIHDRYTWLADEVIRSLPDEESIPLEADLVLE